MLPRGPAACQGWLGLADVQVQTASGSAGPELVIEGFKEFEAIRDFLYARMRGSRPEAGTAAHGVADQQAAPELVAALRQVTAELRATRLALESRVPGPPPRSNA